MKQHIFLTGEVQVGKSTILRKCLESQPKLRIGGFRTVWLQRGNIQFSSIHIVPADRDVPLTDTNRISIRKGAVPDRQCIDFPEIFNTVGVKLLSHPENYDLILMDEIGRAEDNAGTFHDTVLGILEGDIPVLGVVRNLPGILTDAVRAHRNVKLITVTRENRDMLTEMLTTK